MSQLSSVMTSGPLPPSRHRRTWGKAVATIVVIAVFIGMVVGAYLLLRGTPNEGDYPGPGSGEAVVVVERGASLTAIGQVLEEAGVVKTAQAFLDAAAADDRAGTIGPGEYTLLREMAAADALELMLDPDSRADSRLVLPEGLRLDETVETAAAATDIPAADFEAVLEDPSGLGLPKWAKERPQGFMFPATYDLTGDETAESVLGSLVKRFNQASADVGLVERAKDVGLTPYQVLVVASLIEAEAAPADYAKVSRVIYNRLDADMPLQLDSTVSYALGIRELQLSQEQLDTKSPYNTYQNTGLPPRPINSPGQAAIEAALAPADGKWLYFVLIDPRSRDSAFAVSYDRFLELKRQYQENLAEYEREQQESQGG